MMTGTTTKGLLGDICKRYDDEIARFYAGESAAAYRFLGCHFIPEAAAHLFCVWAPNAKEVHVVGEFNDWDTTALPMERYRGLFATLVPKLKDGDLYKYYILGADGTPRYKADPYAFYAETPPSTASKVQSLDGFVWRDEKYIEARTRTDPLKNPLSVYELHLGSWRLNADGSCPNYRQIADELADYIRDIGFTHVELMPVYEYPFDGSWGYQVTGFFAISSRFGTPQDFMYFVDRLHRAGIGVLADWVPAHFPKDAHGLYRFDGSWLYEHAHILRREHPQWGTHIFNYDRPEVVSFLISSAAMMFEQYHLDGIRVDAVSSMLYLDYGRNDHFIRNKDGGNIDHAAVRFLRKLNTALLGNFPGCITVAEESTAFPLVTKPPYDGGLGFLFKWNMGFMHDTLGYMSTDPYFRGGSHDKMTFSMFYAFSENYILAYSHDEVVHGKASMIEKMYGIYEEKFAALKILYAYLYAHPGKKLLFMGDEFAQFIEWDYKKQLDWFLLDYEPHRDMLDFVRKLNKIYRKRTAFFGTDDSWDGFLWLNVEDRKNSVLAFLRTSGEDRVVCVFNFTPVGHEKYRVALPFPGELSLLLDSSAASAQNRSNAPEFNVDGGNTANAPGGMIAGSENPPHVIASEFNVDGGNTANAAAAQSTPERGIEPRFRAKKSLRAAKSPCNGLPCAAQLTLPPLSALYYTYKVNPVKT